MVIVIVIEIDVIDIFVASLTAFAPKNSIEVFLCTLLVPIYCS